MNKMKKIMFMLIILICILQPFTLRSYAEDAQMNSQKDNTSTENGSSDETNKGSESINKIENNPVNSNKNTEKATEGDFKSLSDVQRAGLVKYATTLIDGLGSQNMLRYSVADRKSGYLMKKISDTSSHVGTAIRYVTMVNDDKQRVLDKLKDYVEERFGRYRNSNSTVAQKYKPLLETFDNMTIDNLTPTYIVELRGENLGGTIAFDSASLVSSIYKQAWGVSLDAGGEPWTTMNYYKDKTYFSMRKITSFSDVKPGDLILSGKFDENNVWTRGHIAMFLGNEQNDGNNKIITASGIYQQKKDDKTLSEMLADYLCDNIKKMVEYKYIQDVVRGTVQEKTPEVIPIVLPEGYVREPQQQVYIGNAVMEDGVDYWALEFNAKYIKEGQGLREFQGLKTVDDIRKVRIEKIGKINLLYWESDYKLLDESLANSQGYFHRGAPTYGGYSQFNATYEWYNESASSVLDWVIGFITYIAKSVILGWTAILENIVSNGLAIGTEDMNELEKANQDMNFLQSIGIQSYNKVTVEDVIFNNVPILDINFFDVSTAGGKKLSPNSMIYKIRELIAQWYYTLRVASIIVMSTILVYLAVKLLFTNIAQGKADAKKKLMDWLVGFVIVFSIHYLMIGIITLNNQLLEMLKPIAQKSTVQEINVNNTNSTIGPNTEATPKPETTAITETKQETENTNTTETNSNQLTSITQNNEESFYEKIRVQAYDVSASTGIGATFMYGALVIYLFVFVVMYFKRLFVLIILTITAPIMGVLYAFNKGKYRISNWLREYFNNIIIQLIHAIAYTALMAVAFSFVSSNSFVGSFLAVMLLSFLFTLEGILKKILGYSPEQIGGLSSTGAMLLDFMSLKSMNERRKKINAGRQKIAKGSGYVGSALNKLNNSRVVQSTKDYLGNSALGKGAKYVSDMVDKGIDKVGTSTSAFAEMATDKVNNWIDGNDRNDEKDENISEDTNENIAPKAEEGGKPHKRNKKTYTDYYREAERRKYDPSPELAEKINEKKELLKQGRKAFSKAGGLGWVARTITNTVLGSVSMAISIPLMVVNKGAGVAVGAYGLRWYLSRFGKRNINGYNSNASKGKFTGAKMLCYAMPIGITGSIDAAKNVLEHGKKAGQQYDMFYKNVMAKEEEKIEQLQKAKEIEIDIAEELEKLYPNKNDEIDSKMEIFNKRVNELDKQQFEEILTEILTDVDEKEVKKIVNDFTYTDVKTGKEKIKVNSYGEITMLENRINKVLPKNIKVSSVKFGENLRDDLQRRAGLKPRVEKIKKDKDGNVVKVKQSRLDFKDVKNAFEDFTKVVSEEDKVEISQEETDKIFSDLRKNKKFEAAMKFQDTEKMNKIIQSSLREKIHNKNLQEKMSKKLRKQINNKVVEKTKVEDETVAKYFESMDPNDVVKLISNTLNKEGSVQVDLGKSRFSSLMNKVKKLDEVNKHYEDLSGEKIYESVYELVGQMRNGFAGAKASV